MVNRPEGPTLTKSYRQRKTKEQFLDMGGKGNEKEERSGKFQAAQERNAGQRFFHGLFVSFLMMLTMGSGMGKCEEENYSLKKAG